MNKFLQEVADRELSQAISANEQANSHYYRILRRFTSSKPSLPEEKLLQPDAILDSVGLKEIDTAWIKINNTEKKLRSAYMKLYAASL
jgi:hypothetical protein